MKHTISRRYKVNSYQRIYLFFRLSPAIKLPLHADTAGHPAGIVSFGAYVELNDDSN